MSGIGSWVIIPLDEMRSAASSLYANGVDFIDIEMAHPGTNGTEYYLRLTVKRNPEKEGTDEST